MKEGEEKVEKIEGREEEGRIGQRKLSLIEKR